jgi:hypothetical protein
MQQNGNEVTDRDVGLRDGQRPPERGPLTMDQILCMIQDKWHEENGGTRGWYGERLPACAFCPMFGWCEVARHFSIKKCHIPIPRPLGEAVIEVVTLSFQRQQP